MVKKKKFSLKEEYIKSWKYIKESQRFIWVVVAFFIFWAILGFFITPSENLSDKILDLIKNIVEKTKDLSTGGLIKYIILNNLQVSAMGIISGLILGIFPVLLTISNGYIVGFVARMSVEQAGTLSLFRLVPHGIFELPAVFISLGLGIKLGTFIFYKKKIKILKDFLINSLRVFLTIVIPLLIIAGIIEGLLI